MFVKFLLPDTIYLSGPKRSDLVFGVGVPLTIKGIACNVAVWADAYMFETEERDGEAQELERAKINVTISDPQGQANLNDVIKEQKDADLAALVVSGANIASRSLRYFGYLPRVHEITALRGPEITFTKLRVQVSENGDDWEDYKAEDPLLTHLIESRSNRQELPVGQLRSVINAFEHGAEFIPPENEFVVNSLEHLQEGKYRLAIIECATGLEITLTQVADSYLFFQTLMPEKYREDFLWSPEVGLTARLKGLLFLFLRDEDFEKFRVKDVVTFVKWRNRFIHSPKRKDEGEQRIWPEGASWING